MDHTRKVSPSLTVAVPVKVLGLAASAPEHQSRLASTLNARVAALWTPVPTALLDLLCISSVQGRSRQSATRLNGVPGSVKVAERHAARRLDCVVGELNGALALRRKAFTP